MLRFIRELVEIDDSKLSVLGKKVILLNSWHIGPKHIVNFLILIAKQYVYYCKCSSKQPAFKNLMYKADQVYRYEYYAAQQTNQVNKCLQQGSHMALCRALSGSLWWFVVVRGGL